MRERSRRPIRSIWEARETTRPVMRGSSKGLPPPRAKKASARARAARRVGSKISLGALLEALASEAFYVGAIGSFLLGALVARRAIGRSPAGRRTARAGGRRRRRSGRPGRSVRG